MLICSYCSDFRYGALEAFPSNFLGENASPFVNASPPLSDCVLFIQDGTCGRVPGKQRRHRWLRSGNLPGRDIYVNGVEKGKRVRAEPTQKKSPCY